MSAKSKIEKWLLADWTNHGGNSGARVSDDMKNLTISMDRKEPGKEVEQKVMQARRSTASNGNNDSGAGGSLPNEDRDYSESTSSWAPNEDTTSSDETLENEKENSNRSRKMKKYVGQIVKMRHSKKVLTPVHRPNAVVNILQERQLNGNHTNNNRKRKYKEIKTHVNKSLPDSTRKNTFTQLNTLNETINVQLKNIIEINATFQKLFLTLNSMKPQHSQQKQINNNILNDVNKIRRNVTTVEAERSDRSESEESNRSDDNVLITNKYNKVGTLTNSHPSQNEIKDEWVAIGSGKTLIHKDKYRKVNWKSYTIATRTLLRAAFPRRILATHSLTGKRSPAFQNKPAKMCLDPKIVTDVIIEITSKFKVKENLVRNIITTKCADECKMYKMKLKSKNNSKLHNGSSSDPEIQKHESPLPIN